MLQSIFKELVSHYTRNEATGNRLWQEIEEHYSERNRAYHNLSHLEAMYEYLVEYRHYIQHWHTVLFSLFYHDIIYRVPGSNNEQQSAELAQLRLEEMKFPKEQGKHCYDMILATSNHSLSQDSDTNIFTDADLSILGQERAVYENYCKKIRKEYSLYPAILYNPGRKKVIRHFLEMENIFKTEIFHSRFEQQAKNNLAWEIGIL